MASEPETPPQRAPGQMPQLAGTPPRIEPQPPTSAELPSSPLPTARQPSVLLRRSDQMRNRVAIEERIREVRGVFVQLDRRNLGAEAKDDRARAAAMLDLAEKAIARGDLRQADDLSSRAAMLANTLVNAR
jgi:hypothetical protein